MPSSFGSRLVEQRDRLGLTQGDICELTGINRKTQFAYEKDQRYPDAGYLTTLLKHGFDVSYLLTGERPPRYGAIHEELLCAVLTAVDATVTSAGHSIAPEKKAKLVALVYQTSAENGQVDPLVVQKAVGLIGN
jgi:transcriptional regulator with XRE-family HTH domain